MTRKPLPENQIEMKFLAQIEKNLKDWKANQAKSKRTILLERIDAISLKLDLMSNPEYWADLKKNQTKPKTL
jgi:hypothetical protein